MSDVATEANYVIWAKCGEEVPLSCVVIDKGQIFPELMKAEHDRHELEICYRCYNSAQKKGEIAE